MLSIELTKTFSQVAYTDALESWSWIGLGGKTPLFASLFGDVFLEDADGIAMLSILSGTLERVSADRAELSELLATEDGQDRFLLAGLAFGAHARGILLAPEQVYDFQPPPVLGGATDVDHMVPTDFVVAVNINGQIHDQIRGLPPGTKIAGVRAQGALRDSPKPGDGGKLRRRWRRGS